jgi:hypothetical protein
MSFPGVEQRGLQPKEPLQVIGPFCCEISEIGRDFEPLGAIQPMLGHHFRKKARDLAPPNVVAG